MTAENLAGFFAGWVGVIVVIFTIAIVIDIDAAERLAQGLTICGLLLILLAAIAKFLGG